MITTTNSVARLFITITCETVVQQLQEEKERTDIRYTWFTDGGILAKDMTSFKIATLKLLTPIALISPLWTHSSSASQVLRKSKGKMSSSLGGKLAPFLSFRGQ
jgi:hypothetical protein